MKAIFKAAGIVLLLSFTWGCVPGGLLLTDASNMTPEQMAGYEKLGYDAIRCATISGGPPVGGIVTSVTIPKNRQALVKFVGCQVQTIEVGAPSVGAR